MWYVKSPIHDRFTNAFLVGAVAFFRVALSLALKAFSTFTIAALDTSETGFV